MTYAEAISELQQRSLDALKVARSSQIASLETAREFAQTLSAQRPAAFVAPSGFRAITNLTTAFAFALLEQQVVYAKKLADTFAKSSAPASPRALPAPLLAIATAPPMLTASAPLDEPAEPEVIASDVQLATDHVTSLANDDNAAAATYDAPLAGADVVSPTADDAVSLPADDAVSLTTDDASPPSNGATPSAAHGAISPPADEAMSPGTYDTVATATGEPIAAAVGDFAPPVSEPHDPLLMESVAEAFADAVAMEPTSLTPESQAQSEEVVAKTSTKPRTSSANGAFPASSANAARKSTKTQPGSNPRPKPKRNPGK